MQLDSQIFRSYIREYQRLSLLMQAIRNTSDATPEILKDEISDILEIYGTLGNGSGIIRSGGYLDRETPEEWWTAEPGGSWHLTALPRTPPLHLSDEEEKLEPGDFLFFNTAYDSTDRPSIYIRYKPEETERYSILMEFDWLRFEELYIKPSVEEFLSQYELDWTNVPADPEQIDRSDDPGWQNPRHEKDLFNFNPLQALLNIPHNSQQDHIFVLRTPLLNRKPFIIHTEHTESVSEMNWADYRRDFNFRFDRDDIRGWESLLIIGFEDAPFYRDIEKRSAVNWLQSTLILWGLGLIFLVLVAQYARLKKLREKEKEFVASMTHELRTPLTVIQSAADNLANGIVPPEKVEPYGSMIKDQVQRLGRMIEEILQFSSMEGNAASPDPVIMDPESVLNTVRNSIEAHSETRGISLKWDTEGSSYRFSGDPEILRLGLNNLIMNALNHAYQEKPGPIRVSLRAGIPDALILTVEDEGRGIPSGEQKKIFSPFYRGRFSRQNQEKGSGLGLFITAKKAAATGGYLKVESPYRKIDGTKQQGCRFTLKIPGKLLGRDEN